MNTIGETIAALRKKKGITQEALASAIGVSSQSISKWENNTNMPDIMLLPVIADVFGVNIDILFGRQTSEITVSAEEAFNKCCNAILETMASCMYNPDMDKSFENSTECYKDTLKSDPRFRTGIIRRHGVTYYREEIGALLLKKPQSYWHELLNCDEALSTLNLLSDNDFRIALTEIIKSKKTTFTIASLCSHCKIGDTSALEEKLKTSKLFSTKSIDIDDTQVTIYELTQGQRMFLLFAVLTYAKEYSEYEDIYTGYYGCSDYYFS